MVALINTLLAGLLALGVTTATPTPEALTARNIDCTGVGPSPGGPPCYGGPLTCIGLYNWQCPNGDSGAVPPGTQWYASILLACLWRGERLIREPASAAPSANRVGSPTKARQRVSAALSAWACTTLESAALRGRSHSRPFPPEPFARTGALLGHEWVRGKKGGGLKTGLGGKGGVGLLLGGFGTSFE